LFSQLVGLTRGWTAP